MTDELQNSETNKLRLIMTNSQRRTAINNKIKSASNIYVYNNWAEDYFKSTKDELLKWFSYRFKRQAEQSLTDVYMDSFLTEMENNLRIDEDNDLFFN